MFAIHNCFIFRVLLSAVQPLDSGNPSLLSNLRMSAKIDRYLNADERETNIVCSEPKIATPVTGDAKNGELE